jgi:AraC family transcriptional regulator of arabinose operon
MSIVTEPKKRIKEGFIGQRMIVLPPNIKKAITGNGLIKDFYLTGNRLLPQSCLP